MLDPARVKQDIHTAPPSCRRSRVELKGTKKPGIELEGDGPIKRSRQESDKGRFVLGILF